MKKIRNEQGYTLLLTLILVTLVVTLFSTFTVKALSQQKQVEKTDKTYEAVAVAEMGVEYYRATILNLISAHSKTLFNTLETLRISNQLTSDIITQEKEKQMKALRNEVDSFLTSSINKQIEVSKSPKLALYEITKKDKNPNILNTNYWTIEVSGTINNGNGIKSKTISVTFQLPAEFELVTTTSSNVVEEQPNGSNSEIGKIVFGTLVPIPTFPQTDYLKVKDVVVNKCPDKNDNYGNSNQEFSCFTDNVYTLENILNLNLYYTGETNLGNNLNQNFKNLNKFYANKSINLMSSFSTKKNTSYYINGDFNKTEPINNPDKSIIQATGNINLKNINEMTSMEIYSNKKISISEALSAKKLTLNADSAQFNNLNSLENSKIEINKETTFPLISSFSNSSIQINNSAKFYTINNGINGSQIYIDGNVTFGSVNINSSIIKVNGSAIFTDSNSGNTIYGKSKVVVDNLVFNFSSKNNKEDLLVNGESTLCIRKGSSNILERLKSTANGRIIFLDRSIPKNNIEMLKGYGGGSHILQAGEEKFNTECGITVDNLPTKPVKTYYINNSSLSEDDIISDIIYR